MAIKSLVIGCGGSGISTLIRLNELLAGNPEWRYRICNDVYYLVADTEYSALDRFESKVKEQMGRTAHPFIKRIQLSEGFTILNEVIRPNFDSRPAKEDGKGTVKLAEHWWHNKEGDPFRAPLVFNLQLGAGQCPAASYGLAWWKMEEIERAVEDIIDEMLKRGDSDPNQLVNLNLIIVSGLAGGTGRGCWNLLTFKIRQFLQERYQVEAAPVAIFFDASCFDNVMKIAKSQRISMKVNALTGFSELSCWMRLSRSSLSYDYRLPSMRTPLRADTDVLQTNVTVTRNQMDQAPVNNAYIICESNGVAILSSNVQYHEMVGAGLYALITNSEINAQRVNEPEPFLSMAAATFDVDSIHLQSYLENIARIAAVKELISDDLSYVAEDAKGCSRLSIDVGNFFNKVPLLVQVSGTESISPVQDGLLIPRVYNDLIKELKGRVSNFEEALKRDKLEDAKDAIRSLCNPLEAAKVRESFNKVFESLMKEVLKEFRVNNLGEVIRSMMTVVYKGDGTRPSIGRAQTFISNVEAKLLSHRDALPEILFIDNEAQRANQSPGKHMAEEVEKAWERTFKEKIVGGSHYNAEEITRLVRKANAALLAVNYLTVRQILIEKIEEAHDTLSKLSGALSSLTSTLTVVSATFENAKKRSAGLDEDADCDPHDALFVDSDPQKISDSLVDSGDTVRFYKRVLKPIMTKAEVSDLAASSLLYSDEVHQELAAALDKLIEAKNARKWSDDDRRNLRLRLTDVIRDHVLLSDRFLVENFTFKTVLEKNRIKWNDLIKRRQGNQEEREVLFERFRRFLGVEPVRDTADGSRDFKLPWAEELIKKISVSLMKSCLPWWKLAKNLNQEDLQTVMLFLPIKLDRQNTFENEIKKEIKSFRVNVLHEGNSNGGVTPFHIVTYASQSIQGEEDDTESHEFDKILGLSYYRDPDVDKWLNWAEREDGKSIFYKGANNRGIGYISPVFVRDEALRDIRWKPWTKADVGLDDDKAKVEKSLLYAFLGQGFEKDSPELATITDRFNWPMPVIGVGGVGRATEEFYFRRDPLDLKKGKGSINLTPSWKDADKITVSFDNVYMYLLGEGKPGLDGKAQEEAKGKAKEQLAHLLSEARVFEEHIKPSIGEDQCAVLIAKRNEWLHKQFNKGSKSDKEFWKRLLQAAQHEGEEAAK